LLKLLKGFTGQLDKVGARMCDLEAVTTPFKQGRTEGVFELAQPPTYRGVSNPKLFCRSSETAVVGDDEGPSNRYGINGDGFCDTPNAFFLGMATLFDISRSATPILHLGSLQLELSLSKL
jgi:hypothetical protein